MQWCVWRTTRLLLFYWSSTYYWNQGGGVVAAAAFASSVVSSGASTPPPQQPTVNSPSSADAAASSVAADHQSEVRLISRKIRKCGGNNVTECLDLLDLLPIISTDDVGTLQLLEPAFLEALSVISQTQRNQKRETSSARDHYLQTALDLYEKCPTEAVRARTISVCGQRAEEGGGGYYKASVWWLLGQDPQPPSIQSVNAALAVCSQVKDWQEARRLLYLNRGSRGVSTLSCNIVLTAMERAKQGAAALDLLEKMMTNNNDPQTCLPPPNKSSFHHTMNALIADTSSSNEEESSSVDHSSSSSPRDL